MRTRGPVNGFWSESGISISRISGMTSRKASEVKKKEHRDARKFARLLGIGREYKTNLFNSDEVDFLVIKEKGVFHIFWNKEVVRVLADNYEVENSKRRGKKSVQSPEGCF